MVATASLDSLVDDSYLSSLTKPLNRLNLERGEDTHVQQWSSSSPSYLDDTNGTSTFGEEGLTQSPSSVKADSDEALKTLSQLCEFSSTREFSEEQNAFDEIFEALRSTPLEHHPFLNMDEQRSVTKNERMQRWYEFFLSMGQKSTFPPNELSILSKSLLNEAHRVHISRVRRYNKTCHEKSLPMKNEEEINRQWRNIQSAVERDLYMEGFVFVQRRLSCMCLFNPDTDDRPYWDNENAREQRLRRQERVLEILREQMKTEGKLFLHV